MAIKKNVKKDNKNWFETVNTMNPIKVTGKVCKKVFESDKVCKYSIELASKTDKGKYRRAWILGVDFNGFELVEGEVYVFDLTIVSSSYNDTMRTEFIISDVDNELELN